MNENINKKKKILNERNSLLLEKNNTEMDEIKQKNLDLEAELQCSKLKSKNLAERVCELEHLIEVAQTKSIKII